MPKGREVPRKTIDWRAFDTPFWFKFVRGDAGRKLDGKTLKGMYVSADWMRLAMTDSTFKAGPRSGFRVTYNNTKYLGRGAFTQLISRGFIGTASTVLQAFKKAMAKLGSDRELIIAIKTEWQNDTETNEHRPLQMHPRPHSVLGRLVPRNLLSPTRLQAVADAQEEVDPGDTGSGEGCRAECHPDPEPGFCGGVRVTGRR